MADQNDDEMLSSFLRSFPTYQLHSKPQSEDELWVFSSSKDDEGSQKNPYSFSDEVISAFSKLKIVDEWAGEYVQFWAPVTIGGRNLLSVSAQPFAVTDLVEYLRKYRECCVEYGYSINVNSNNVILDDMIEQDEHRRPKIISNGPPLSAFFSRLPEFLTINTIVHHEAGPLLGYGYKECGLRFSLMMPIWDSSRSSSSSSDCIGVVEFSSLFSFDLQVFNTMMNEVLEEVGLRAFSVQDHVSYKTISGLKPTKEQIQEALETICKSQNICLAQVWISYQDDNHEHFSSSLMGAQMKQMLALKLTGYISPYGQLFEIDWLSAYYHACDMIPLKKGDELVLKTFQDYEPRFYKDNSNLGTDMLLAGFSVGVKKRWNGLTICMRNIDTSDFDYAFEFIWFHNSNTVIFLEELLLTLKRCLPHFKCASGEVGDELQVIELDNSTKSETKTFKIFQENRSSPIPEAVEKGKKAMIVDRRANTEVKCKTAKKDLPREVIEQQFGNTMKEAAENLQVSVSTLKRKLKGHGITEWQGPDSRKRKVYDSFDNQNCTNEKDYGAIQDPLSFNRDENTLTIKAEYADDTIKFELPISEATFDTIEKEIGMRFELRLGTYRLKYRDGGDWISLLSNKDMIYYMETLRRLGQTEARLSVFIRSH